MASSEVFRPSDGELMVRDTLSEMPRVPTDMYRKVEDRRPSTQGGGYRFGQLSHNSFFTRHNPHPGRVKHLKGLLDVPICSVNDDGFFANPRFSLNFPPNQHNTKRLEKWKGQIPVNAINVNSQLHPINTVTGLQYFTGLNSYPYREKAIPKVGMVPVTEAWRDELSSFTRLLQDAAADQPIAAAEEEKRPRTSQYSANTGRLIPPPSRAMTRHSRRGRTTPGGFVGGNLQHISSEPDMENSVLVMLCQILQTEDVNSVQAWLCSAGEREKDHVMTLVRSAFSGREEYYKQHPAEFIPDDGGRAKLPPINRPPGSATETNRLVIEEDAPPMWMPPVPELMQPTVEVKTVIDDGDMNLFAPPTNDAFKSLPTARAVMTPAARPPPTPKSPTALKYTKSPTKELDNMWSQKQSLNTF